MGARACSRNTDLDTRNQRDYFRKANSGDPTRVVSENPHTWLRRCWLGLVFRWNRHLGAGQQSLLENRSHDLEGFGISPGLRCGGNWTNHSFQTVG